MSNFVNDYELVIVLKPLLPDDVRKAIHKGIMELATSNGGSVEDTDVWGKRYLAYNIKGHNEGYYIVYGLKLDPASIMEIRRQLELKQEILRYMLVKIEHKEELGQAFKKKEISVDEA
ncbi:MAG: 30S ribosomal protein S6 [Candidatus Dojkabacteria bacterium]